MKILLIGYGKMGKVIERIALERGHEITARIDIDNPEAWDTAHGDVAIEFTHPSSVAGNLRRCLEKNIPVVCGTTGWLDQKAELETLCQKKNGSFFYASNYSLGVNLFFKVNEFLAKMMDRFPEYDIAMEETHHTEKKDAPSGTAITLAEGIIKNMKRKKNWTMDKTKGEESLSIESFRVGQVPGTHVVRYVSPVDDLEIKHTAHSREGFALGAVLVAEWLPGHKGVLGMDQFLPF